MSDQEMNDFQNAQSEDIQVAGEAAGDETTANETAQDEQTALNEQQEHYKKYRETSYGVLFIAAVFVINAMETGSYRTPWPVAIIVTLIGLGMFGYSWYLQSQKK